MSGVNVLVVESVGVPVAFDLEAVGAAEHAVVEVVVLVVLGADGREEPSNNK